MKFCKEPKVEYIPQEAYDIQHCWKMIEAAARNCYASETGKLSSQQFVNKLIQTKHNEPLEFGIIYLTVSKDVADKDGLTKFYKNNKYSRVEIVSTDDEDIVYITTNYRVITENKRQFDLQYVKEPDFRYQDRYLTFRVTTSIGVSREINRYRHKSKCERSTRYCNFSKDKFGNELTFMQPSWVDSTDPKSMSTRDKIFYNSCMNAENDYMHLLEEGCKPEEARDVLPLSTETVVMYSAPVSSWEHFLDQRYFETTGKAHPECKKVAALIHGIMENLSLEDK